MSSKRDDPADTEMRPTYDFTGGVQGKYAERYAKGTNVVVLDPDVSRVFPDAQSVNRALRALAGIIEDRSKKAAIG